MIIKQQRPSWKRLNFFFIPHQTNMALNSITLHRYDFNPCTID
jgi:hypothetical protein